MAPRPVAWTKTADIQFVGILEYWTKKNKSTLYPQKLVQLVSKRTQLISTNPFIFRSTPFKGVRVAPLGPFNMYYKVTKERIIITAFWDNRQDPRKLWEILRKPS
ncbi:type II toxin-antitoxin system RelE/ParE family toxin [Flagellimonas flava]|uniref:type II toxin-antitoxin system RelE/ParE family toxin n=1 Tax=Flagellimonas flava TaxID=570519 RepID=UPI003D64F98D